MPDQYLVAAGDLPHRVIYQVPTEVGRDARGRPVMSWAAVGTYWASVKTVGGREAAVAERLQIKATHSIRTRYFAGASALGRFLFKGRILNITFVNNVDEKSVALDYFAEEVSNPP